MAAAPERTDPLAELFVSVTGQASVTEPQRAGDHRVADRDAQAVSDYVRTVSRDSGLDDALAEPDAE